NWLDRDFVVHVDPLRDPGGAIVGIIGLALDVTERRRMEEQLRQAGKLEAIGRLAGGVAHDFNNLLTAILGNLNLVLAALPEEHPQGELLVASERAAGRAAELTGHLLGFARRSVIRPSPIKLNAIVGEVVGLLKRALDPRIVVTVDCPADLGTVR